MVRSSAAVDPVVGLSTVFGCPLLLSEVSPPCASVVAPHLAMSAGPDTMLQLFSEGLVCSSLKGTGGRVMSRVLPGAKQDGQDELPP